MQYLGPSRKYLNGVSVDEALSCARGEYQRSLVLGTARWSGADLRGEAKKWGAGYARSRNGLLDRLSTRFGARLVYDRDQNRKLVCVIGNGPLTSNFV